MRSRQCRVNHTSPSRMTSSRARSARVRCKKNENDVATKILFNHLSAESAAPRIVINLNDPAGPGTGVHGSLPGGPAGSATEGILVKAFSKKSLAVSLGWMTTEMNPTPLFRS
jgi:hypothetical protein